MGWSWKKQIEKLNSELTQCCRTELVKKKIAFTLKKKLSELKSTKQTRDSSHARIRFNKIFISEIIFHLII
jgi:hypothetical protein